MSARHLAAALAGGVFSLGLVLSDMINPSRVLAFLDVTSGRWDPTLAFVMGGAMVPMLIAWRMSARMAQPVLGGDFPDRPTGGPDTRLLAGAAIFGLGWGLVGLCPGPALAGIVVGGWGVLIFVVAMVAGMIGHHLSTQKGLN